MKISILFDDNNMPSAWHEVIGETTFNEETQVLIREHLAEYDFTVNIDDKEINHFFGSGLDYMDYSLVDGELVYDKTQARSKRTLRREDYNYRISLLQDWFNWYMNQVSQATTDEALGIEWDGATDSFGNNYKTLLELRKQAKEFQLELRKIR
ncbi:MAG: hypothetical protein FWE13_01805 [Firmicutes bacterium]|nr:hypothetical protein [Bacillota bacterium]